MSDFLMTLLGSTIAAVLAAPVIFGMGSLIYRRRARNIRGILGPHASRDPVIIRPSVIEAKRVVKLDDVSHEVKGNLLDSFEISGAYAIKEHLESPRWLSRIARALGQADTQSGIRSPSVIIDTPGTIGDWASEEQGELDLPRSCPMILLGSGVFNPKVRELHNDSDIARIILDTDECSPMPPGQPRLRKIVMPGDGGTSYARRTTHKADKNGNEIFEDYALIQRIIVKQSHEQKRSTVYFVIAGLGSGGTGAAIRYFLEKWPKIEEYSDDPNGFTIVLTWSTTDFSVRPTRDEVRKIDPSNNERPKPIVMNHAYRV